MVTANLSIYQCQALLVLAMFLGIIMPPTVFAAAQLGLLKSEFIFETAPFPSCHASTIVQTTNDGLLAAWFGGTRERDPDVEIWLSRLVEGHWTAPVSVANGVQSPTNRLPCW